jgi:uncharacterized protein (TIGR04255 family)
MKTNLPDYEKPPVIEVVCGIQFKALEGFRIPHFGLFWELFKAEFPTCQEVAPLIPTFEHFGAEEVEPQVPMELPLPRVWFLNSDETGIVQLQRDRFLRNWKKGKPTDEYPRYSVVIELFRRHLQSFQDFVAQQKLGRIEPTQYEMSYVNHIAEGEGWSTLADLSKVFRDFSWNTDPRFLPSIEHLNLRKTFALPDHKGRMHVSIRDGNRREDKKPVILFEFTVRGFPGIATYDAMCMWFDLAHEWIVRGFADLATEAIQKNVWLRKR